MELEKVALELYGLRPNEFVTVRDQRASEARSAGDKNLAAEIKRLRKPTVSAWLANSLVRERPDEVTGLLRLGEQMRTAQQSLDGDELRALSQRRKTAIASLVESANTVAGAADEHPNDAALKELTSTLDAAVADPDAANALRAGQLITALSYSGFGVFDLTPPSSTTSPRPKQAKERKGGTEKKAPDRSKDTERAKVALTQAKAVAASSAREVEKTGATLQKAQEELQRIGTRIDEQRSQLERLMDIKGRAEAALRSAQEAFDSAESRLRDAKKVLDRAEKKP